MKQKLQSLLWPTGLLVLAGILCATYLLAQIRPGNGPVAGSSPAGVNTPASLETNSIPDPAQEAADSALLIQAVNGGDYQTAMEILHNYNVAEDTLLTMAARLGQTPQRVALQEPFLRGVVSLSLSGRAKDIPFGLTCCDNNPDPSCCAKNSSSLQECIDCVFDKQADNSKKALVDDLGHAAGGAGADEVVDAVHLAHFAYKTDSDPI